MVNRIGALLLGGILLLSAQPGAVAQEGPQETERLGRELQQLQQENKVLMDELNQQQTLTEQLLQKVQTLEGRDVALTEQVRLAAEVPAFPLEPEIAMTPKLTIKVFGDAGYTWLRTENDINDNAFWMGRQDVFFISQLSDRISGLLEADLHFHSLAPTTSHFHMERALLRYALSDLWNITIGIMHTPIGYWGHTFHHGAWLQTTIFAPDIFEFERGEIFGAPQPGGVIPIHNAGIDVSGTVEVPSIGDLMYNAGVFNGRPDDLDDVSNNNDQNDFKAVNFHLMLMPHHVVEGLTLGSNIYFDKIAAERSGAANLQFRDGVREIILGGYATYYRGGLEVLAETFWFHHEDMQRDTSYNSQGGYYQMGYRFAEKYTPYYRWDVIDYANADPVWDGEQDISAHRFGLRWDVSDWSALKVEWRHANYNKGREDEDTFFINSSWTF